MWEMWCCKTKVWRKKWSYLWFPKKHCPFLDFDRPWRKMPYENWRLISLSRFFTSWWTPRFTRRCVWMFSGLHVAAVHVASLLGCEDTGVLDEEMIFGQVVSTTFNDFCSISSPHFQLKKWYNLTNILQIPTSYYLVLELLVKTAEASRGRDRFFWWYSYMMFPKISGSPLGVTKWSRLGGFWLWCSGGFGLRTTVKAVKCVEAGIQRSD